MSQWLNRTGRPILYSCSWPAYQEGHGMKVNYTKVAQACNSARNGYDVEDSWESVSSIIEQYGVNALHFAEAAGPGFWNDPDMPPYQSIAKHCNIWRNWRDIRDSWDSVSNIVEFYGNDTTNFSTVAGPGNYNDPDQPDYDLIAKYCNIWRNWDDIQDSWDSLSGIITKYGDDNTNFSRVAGPGNFNDPDMLILGNFGLSYDQERVQMGMWAIMASPLIMSTDLRNIRNSSKALLQNKNVIAINQDPMGVQGKRIQKAGIIQIWTKPIMPSGSVAFAFVSTGTATPSKVSIKLSELGLKESQGYQITEVFEGKSLGKMKGTDTFSAMVNPTGIFLGKATPA